MSGRLLVKKRGAGASEPETSQERAVNRRKGEEDWADQLLDGLIGPVPSRLSLLNRAAEWTQHGREREREARSSIDSPRKLAHFSRLSTLFSSSFASLLFISLSYISFFFHCSIDDIFTSFVKGGLVPSQLSAPLWIRTLVDEAESRVLIEKSTKAISFSLLTRSA